MKRSYRVGEVVLMEYQGWLKAFRVVGTKIIECGDTITTEYRMALVELENGPVWHV